MDATKVNLNFGGLIALFEQGKPCGQATILTASTKAYEVMFKSKYFMIEKSVLRYNDSGQIVTELINLQDIYQISSNEKSKIKQITHFFNTLKSVGISENTINYFYKSGYCTILSILNLTKEQLVEFEGFGIYTYEKTAQDIYNLFNYIKSNIWPIAQLQDASGLFPGLGVKTLSVIDIIIDAQYYFQDSYYNEIKQYLLKLEGLGNKSVEIILNNIINFYEFCYFNNLKYAIK